MEDIISLSSGSDEDSDIEFVSSYKDGNTHNAIPFIRAELLPVTPVLIDITKHLFPPCGPRHSQKVKTRQRSPVEVIDLNKDSLRGDEQLRSVTSDCAPREAGAKRVQSPVRSCENVRRTSCTVNLDEDVIYLDSGEDRVGGSPVCGPDQVHTDDGNVTESHLAEKSIHKSGKVSRRGSPCAMDRLDSKEIKAQEPPHVFDTSNGPTCTLQDNVGVEEAQNTNHAQNTSPSCPSGDEKLDFSQNGLDKAPSPFSPGSPYYCPSEIDAVLFSDESDMEDSKDDIRTVVNLNRLESAVLEHTGQDEKQPPHISPSQPQLSLQALPLPTPGGTSPSYSLPCGPKPASPISIELLETGSDLIRETPPSSPVPSCTLSPSSLLPSRTETVVPGIKGSVSSEDSSSRHSTGEMDSENLDIPEPETQEGQHVSVVQYKKLKHLIGGRAKEMPEADDEDGFGQAEPLCRQSLSLVYSTIEENYPEGTLQLLSDLIQPCYYPPADITAHLLRGILLDPQCAEVLAVEAYNLLMRTQKYHPADRAMIPWDWELISSVINEQDETKRLRTEVRCLLLQYVLQVLEDDFQCKLPMLRLHLSIAKEMLSCDQKLSQVKELLRWLLDAAKQSFSATEDEEMQRREQSCCLRMLLVLQRMLLLAIEVDLTPARSSTKLSEELRIKLNRQGTCRRLRMLLLSTLESNLLRCKLVELLLDQACSQKKALQMSFRLLLHFLHTSTLAPDPSDGAERWRRWDELLQLVWMLMLSYHEVVTAHLHCSITERFRLSRSPVWTENDHVTRAEVQQAAEAFQCRAMEDLGHELPSHIQESLSQLQEHLLSISLH